MTHKYEYSYMETIDYFFHLEVDIGTKCEEILRGRLDDPSRMDREDTVHPRHAQIATIKRYVSPPRLPDTKHSVANYEQKTNQLRICENRNYRYSSFYEN